MNTMDIFDLPIIIKTKCIKYLTSIDLESIKDIDIIKNFEFEFIKGKEYVFFMYSYAKYVTISENNKLIEIDNITLFEKGVFEIIEVYNDINNTSYEVY